MIEHVAVTWLVNALWLVPAIAASASLCARVGRFGPRARQGAWMAAMVLALSLPALPAAVAPTRLAAEARLDVKGPPTATGDLAPFAAPRDDPPPLLALDRTWMRAILCLAGAAAAIGLCRLLFAIRAGRRLVDDARPCGLDPDVLGALSQARDARPAPPILESEAISSPVVVGAARPAILVPRGFTSLPWDEQRAALLHEMAHVARRDYAWNLVCEAVSLPLVWHPAILPIKAGIRRSREAACDALAAQAMSSSVTYAKCLVSLATRLGAARPVPAVVVGLIGKSDLEERLMTLLNPRPGRVSGALRMAGATAIAATILVPAVLLRVTPAFADEPVVARRLLVSAPAPSVVAPAPALGTAPVAPAPARAPRKAIAAIQPAAAIAAATAPEPPPPSEPVAATPAPPPPPPPPPPPAESMDGPTMHVDVDRGRYDAVVHRALARALGAERVMESDAMRRALGEIRANQAAMTRAAQARVHAEIATAMAELDHARLKETLDKLKSQLNSPAFHHAIAEAARQAAAEVQSGDTKD